MARRLLQGDADLAVSLATSLIVPARDNFVERPWGGTAMARFKRLEVAPGGAPIGETFEIAAFDADAEASRYPSRLALADGSELTLPQLLAVHGRTILGAPFVARFGACFPLLPKTLDIRELLSVQGHPEGNTEVYVVIEAEPDATLRLGFGADVDATALREDLMRGLDRQHELLALLVADIDVDALQRTLKAWFADRVQPVVAVEADIVGSLRDSGSRPALAELLAQLKAHYWRVLDSLNVLPVAAGDVILNATPPRVLAKGGRRIPSAEVHALGNPEGREIVALEIRRPGPTFRAWDNVRFPVRGVDVDAACAALSFHGTSAEEFRVVPSAVAGKPGTYCSVDSAFFRIEHLRPNAALAVDVDAEPPHCLHVLAGAVTVTAAGGRALGALGRGDSALVPVGVGGYAVSADADAEVVKVSLPMGG